MPNTYVIPDDYKTISEAVNSVSNGSILKIKAGIYKDNIHIKHANITIIGESKSSTIILGNGTGIGIDSSNIKTLTMYLKNITIKNYEIGINDSKYLILHMSNCNIVNNKVGIKNKYGSLGISDSLFQNNEIGIKLYKISGQIVNNTFINNIKYSIVLMNLTVSNSSYGFFSIYFNEFINSYVGVLIVSNLCFLYLRHCIFKNCSYGIKTYSNIRVDYNIFYNIYCTAIEQFGYNFSISIYANFFIKNKKSLDIFVRDGTIKLNLMSNSSVISIDVNKTGLYEEKVINVLQNIIIENYFAIKKDNKTIVEDNKFYNNDKINIFPYKSSKKKEEKKNKDTIFNKIFKFFGFNKNNS